MNEAPPFFARDADVMRLWRELTHNKSMQRGEDEARLVLAIVRAVGFTSAELERDDVDHFFLYLGPPADQSGMAAARATLVETSAPADPP